MHQKRKVGGMLRPVLISICLAAVFFVLPSLLGYDPATHLSQTLAASTPFVQQMLLLETGAVAPQSQTVPPHATASHTEQETAIVPESAFRAPDTENTAPVLQSADRSGTVAVNNESGYPIDAAACLSNPLSLSAAADGPTVLILHTHGSEAYAPDAAFPYTPTETERTTDSRYNVVRVGDELQRVLEDAGIGVIHCRALFDSPEYTGAYDRALTEIEEMLAQYPSISIVIDLHRDSILTEDGTAYQTSYRTPDDTRAAQVMFVVGTDAGGLSHDNWRENFNIAANLQYALNRAYPGLMRPLNLRTQRFNQHARPGSMLLEVGSSGNTLTEALVAVRLFGGVLASSISCA